MGLSEELISQFVQVTNDTKQTKNKSESTAYGQIVEYEGTKYVRIDGSELLTPVVSTASAVDGDRVTVLIKNHTATVTGNISSPSVGVDDVTGQNNAITALEIAITKKVDTKDLVAEQARIDNLVTENATIKGSMSINEANISDLQSKNLEVTNKLTAAEAAIENLETTKLDSDAANITYAKIESLTAVDVKIHNLSSAYSNFVETTTERLDTVEAEIDNLKANTISAHEPVVLWGGDLSSGMYMTAAHEITLKEAVSAQRHGIVLVFSAYNGASDTNYSWESFFVPKQLVALSTAGHTFVLGQGKFTYVGTKYLYISDTKIVGHADNNLTGSNNGITYANNKFVLRYVIGV